MRLRAAVTQLAPNLHWPPDAAEEHKADALRAKRGRRAALAVRCPMSAIVHSGFGHECND